MLELKDAGLLKQACYINGQWMGADNGETLPEEERDKPIERFVINGTGRDQVGTDWTGPHKNTLQRVKMETGPSLAPFFIRPPHAVDDPSRFAAAPSPLPAAA